MNKNIFNLVENDSISDEVKVKLIMLSIKMDKCQTISECKQILLSLVDILSEVESFIENDKCKMN